MAARKHSRSSNAIEGARLACLMATARWCASPRPPSATMATANGPSMLRSDRASLPMRLPRQLTRAHFSPVSWSMQQAARIDKVALAASV